VRIAVAADDEGALLESLRDHLVEAGHEVIAPVPDGTPWAQVGRAVGEAVSTGKADVGVVCCWTGTGVSIAANKVPGVRAALCVDVETARGARRWNDANVLALSMRSTTPAVGEAIVDAFLVTEADEAERAGWSELP